MTRAIGEIVQISASPKGGVPKRALPEAQVTPLGLAEDWQKNRKLHGGPERALERHLARVELDERSGLMLGTVAVLVEAGRSLGQLDRGRRAGVLIEVSSAFGLIVEHLAGDGHVRLAGNEGSGLTRFMKAAALLEDQLALEFGHALNGS